MCLLYEYPEFGNLQSLLLSVWEKVTEDNPPPMQDNPMSVHHNPVFQQDDADQNIVAESVDFTLGLLMSFMQDITTGLSYLHNKQVGLDEFTFGLFF